MTGTECTFVGSTEEYRGTPRCSSLQKPVGGERLMAQGSKKKGQRNIHLPRSSRYRSDIYIWWSLRRYRPESLLVRSSCVTSRRQLESKRRSPRGAAVSEQIESGWRRGRREWWRMVDDGGGWWTNCGEQMVEDVEQELRKLRRTNCDVQSRTFKRCSDCISFFVGFSSRTRREPEENSILLQERGGSRNSIKIREKTELEILLEKFGSKFY